MKDQFVPYDLALKMKELGFREKTLIAMAINKNGEKQPKGYWDCDPILFNKEGECVIPLWQQAFDWFSDNKKISGHTIDYEGKCLWMIRIKGDKTGTAKGYSKFEKTRQEARIECLKKLIELCKKNL